MVHNTHFLGRGESFVPCYVSCINSTFWFLSIKAFVCFILFNLICRVLFSREIWKCCISLFSFGPLERLDAYLVLSLYFLFCHMECEDVTVDNTGEEFDIRAMEEFWKEIQKGLVYLCTPPSLCSVCCMHDFISSAKKCHFS